MSRCYHEPGKTDGWMRSISIVTSVGDPRAVSIVKKYGFSHDIRFVLNDDCWAASVAFFQMVFYCCFKSVVYDVVLNGSGLDLNFEIENLDPGASGIPNDYARVSFYDRSVLGRVNLSGLDIAKDEAFMSIRNGASAATHNWHDGSIWLPAVSPDSLRMSRRTTDSSFAGLLARSGGPVNLYSHEIGHSLGYVGHSMKPGAVMSEVATGKIESITKDEVEVIMEMLLRQGKM